MKFYERVISYYSLRYLWNRSQLFIYEYLHPNDPWMPRSFISFLDAYLTLDDTVFEFGAGRSTVWISGRVNNITSVERNKRWYHDVRNKIGELRIKNVNLLYEPDPNINSGDVNDYVEPVCRFPEDFFDVVIVDGGNRAVCALSSLPHIKPGGLLVIDDVHRYLPSSSTVPHARGERVGPLNDDWRQFRDLTDKWRCVVFSDGVTDTGVFFKPI